MIRGPLSCAILTLLLALSLALPSAPAFAHSAPSRPSVECLGDAVVSIALGEVGVHEVGGNNRGPQVESYIRTGGGQPGHSWCMYLVYWTFDHGATRVGINNPLKRTGACWDQLRAALQPHSQMKVIIPTAYLGVRPKLKPGDVAIHSRKASRGSLVGRQFPGHAEVVVEDQGSYYRSVGGNTSCGDGSQYDGDAVCLKRRRKVGGPMPVQAFLRYNGPGACA